jgi:hypothetical protein
MKKALLLALTLLVPTYPVHAVNIKTAATKLIKCSWHAAKVGGGMGCLSICCGTLLGGFTVYSRPPLPDVTNMPQDRQILKDYLKQFSVKFQKINPALTEDFMAAQIVEHVQRSKGDNNITFDNLTTDQIHIAFHGFISSAYRRCAVVSLAFFAAGSASIWSGIKGLYDEAKQTMEPAEKEETENIAAI